MSKLTVTIRQDDTSTFTWSKTHLLQYIGGIMERDASCLIQFRDGTEILVIDSIYEVEDSDNETTS